MADVFISFPKNFYTGLIDLVSIRLVYRFQISFPILSQLQKLQWDYDCKDLGTVLIDVGKNQTLVIYEDGYPQDMVL